MFASMPHGGDGKSSVLGNLVIDKGADNFNCVLINLHTIVAEVCLLARLRELRPTGNLRYASETDGQFFGKNTTPRHDRLFD